MRKLYSDSRISNTVYKIVNEKASGMTRTYKAYPYDDRESRNRFVAEHFKDYLGNSVLSVGGGGERFLGRYLPRTTIFRELDIVGSPDIKCNLEKDLPVPANDSAFDTVVCTDVLEHLENIHDVFLELVRISRKHLIISLPNPVSDIRSYIFNQPERSLDPRIEPERGRYLKFYGLPIEVPMDRHKWFFGYVDAEIWIRHYSKKHFLDIVELFGLGYKTHKTMGQIMRWTIGKLFGEDARKNIFCRALWCVLRKN